MSDTASGRRVPGAPPSAGSKGAETEREQLPKELVPVAWGGLVFGVLCAAAFVDLVWISRSSTRTVTPELLGVLTLGLAGALIPRLLPYVSRLSAAGIEVEMVRHERHEAEGARDEAQKALKEAQAARDEALKAARQASFLGTYLPAETMFVVTDALQQIRRTGQYKWRKPAPLRRAFLVLARREGQIMTFGEFCDEVTNWGWTIETPGRSPSDPDLSTFEFSDAGRLLSALEYMRSERVVFVSSSPHDPYSRMLGMQHTWVPAIEKAFATCEPRPQA
jgi:hypothetical protein